MTYNESMNLIKTVKHSIASTFIATAFLTIGAVHAPANEIESQSLITMHKDTSCLAQVIYDEARGEPFKGQLAVANVVKNRADSWGRSVCGVVYHKRGRICQFSGMCSKKAKPVKREFYELAYRILNNEFNDVTKGATYFHATYVAPNWARHSEFRKTTKIGKHVFYRSDQTL